MKYCTGIFAVLSLFLVAACAPVQPTPDPIKEEVVILQKQLLELQKLQSETKAKLDESNATINTLSTKLEALEERRAVRPVAVSQPQIVSKPATTAPGKKQSPAPKKKPAKKTKKKARRQG